MTRKLGNASLPPLRSRIEAVMIDVNVGVSKNRGVYPPKMDGL